MCVLLTACALTCYSQDDLSLDDLLAKYEKTILPNYPTSSYEIFAKETLSKSNSSQIKTSIVNMKIIHNMDSLDVVANKQYIHSASEYVDRGIITDQGLMFTKRPGEKLDFVSILSEKKRIQEMREGLVNTELGCILNGCVRGSYLKTISEIIKEEPDLKYSITQDVLDGQKVVLAEFDTKYGLCRFWLDPDSGYCPKKIVIETNAGDIYFKNTIGTQPKPINEGVYEFLPNEIISNVVLTAYPIESKKIGANFFPVSAKVVENIIYKNGITAKATLDFEQKEINLNPDFEKIGAFKLKPDEIPNGTKVYFSDRRNIGGLKYEWHNGTYRAAVDLEELEQVNNVIAKCKNENNVGEILNDNNGNLSCKTTIYDSNKLSDCNVSKSDLVLKKSISNKVPLFFVFSSIILLVYVLVAIRKRKCKKVNIL